MKSIEWVFFDLDGTLHNHAAAAAGAVQTVFRDSLKIPGVDRRDFLSRWIAEQARLYDMFSRGGATETEYRRTLIKTFVPNLAVKAADQAMTLYAAEYARQMTVYADVPPMFFALKGRVKFGVITNGNGQLQRRKIKKLGLDELFSVVVVSGDVGVHKPDRKIFRHALELARVDAAAAVYVGDALDSDAEAARRAGFRSIWLNRISHQRSIDIPTISSLEELPALVPGVLGEAAAAAPF